MTTPLDPTSVELQASAVPAANGSIATRSDPGTVSQFSSGLSATASGVLAYDPYAVAAVTSAEASPGGSSLDLFSTARVSYEVEVVGPDGAPVPVALQSALSTSASTASNVLAMASLEIAPDEDDLLLYATACSGDEHLEVVFGCGSAPAGESLDRGVLLVPNQPYQVSLVAQTITNPQSFVAPFSLSATVDPTFTVAADYARSYSIAYSPGVLAPPTMVATPEPASWMLLATGGMAAVGVVRRRR